jgi:hypothetical protein
MGRARPLQYEPTIELWGYVVQTFHGDNLYGMFFFREEDAANLAAKSISQAMELCGGKVK